MKKRIPFLLLILLLSVYTFSQERGLKKVVRTPQGKEITLYKGSYALVVGNGKYTAGWDELPGAVKDAEEIADVLRRKGFRVTLVKNVDKRTFLSEFSNFTYRYGQDEDNQLLFYYAGHGHTITLASAEEMGMLVMVDAPLPEKDPQDFDSKSVDMKSIITWALKMKSKHVLFMFDSCFSGTVLNLRERVMPKAISDAVIYPVRQFITAGRAAEPVPDRSVFKQLFIDILEGRVEEPIKDGYITGEELGLFLKNRVPEYNKFQHPQYGKIRDPNLDKGDFVFVLEKAGLGVQEEIPTPPKAEKLDLSSIEESAKRREEARRKWSNWQEQMESDSIKVKRIDQNPENTAEEKKNAWEAFLRNYKTDNPYSNKDEQLRQRATQRLKSLSEVGISVGARISLRSTPRILSLTEAQSIWNKSRDFINEYDVKTIRGDKVVLDHATGLMWHQSGSENNLTYNKAKQWIDELNSRDHADYTDWRLPTLEEAVSLLERSKMNGGLYVDPLFSTRQKWVWTSDRVMAWTGKPVIDPPGRVWVVSFSNGSVYMCSDDPGNGLDWETYGPSNYVRPVRSGQKKEVKVQARVSLRSNAKSMNNDEVKAMLKSRGFFDSERNKSGDFGNNYESKVINGNRVVLDHSTGLMWHQSGSEEYITYEKAKQWIDDLNRRSYAGYRDWRLPTLEEAASLLERTKMNDDLYIDPKFSASQRSIWTNDISSDSSGRAWVVLIYGGCVYWHDDIDRGVRPVRSGQR